MLISHDRDKLIHAIIYFADRTRYCGKVKLFKLLYFLDFEHFKQTSRSVTGLTYSAWKMGPVPVDLHEELEAPEPDLSAAVAITTARVGNGHKVNFKPLTSFDSSLFSPRELKLLNKLATEFRDSYADDMIEATHLENKPWDRVFNQENRKQEKIPYEYVLLTAEEADMRKKADEYRSIVAAFSEQGRQDEGRVDIF